MKINQGHSVEQKHIVQTTIDMCRMFKPQRPQIISVLEQLIQM
jgi:hypothetical protein